MAALPIVEATDGLSMSEVSSIEIGAQTMNVWRLTHSDNVTQDSIAERKVAGDGNQEIDKARRAIAGHDNTSGPKVGIVADFIQD